MVGSRDAIFEHCGDDDAEQRWEDQLEEFDRCARLVFGDDAQPPTDRQRYAMRVSWQETERHMRLRKKVKKQWDVQNPPTEGDDIMDAARKAESPAIKEAGLPSGVAEAVVDPRLMPPQEMVRQWAEQTEPLREGASINEVQPTPADQVFGLSRREAEEEHGLGRFKQGMQTPEPVAQRLVGRTGYIHDGTRNDAVSVTMSPTGMHVIVDGVEYVRRDVAQREETVEEHLIRIGVTYKHRTAAKTGRVWLNVPADALAKAEGRTYTKEKP